VDCPDCPVLASRRDVEFKTTPENLLWTLFFLYFQNKERNARQNHNFNSQSNKPRSNPLNTPIPELET
jgi:hypothetical protein